MFSSKTKSTASAPSKAAPRTLLQSVRDATAGRGLQASRGGPIGTRVSSQAAKASLSADRTGAVVTLLLSLTLTAAGSLMIAQIWANLAMIR